MRLHREQCCYSEDLYLVSKWQACGIQCPPHKHPRNTSGRDSPLVFSYLYLYLHLYLYLCLFLCGIQCPTQTSQKHVWAGFSACFIHICICICVCVCIFVCICVGSSVPHKHPRNMWFSACLIHIWICIFVCAYICVCMCVAPTVPHKHLRDTSRHDSPPTISHL